MPPRNGLTGQHAIVTGGAQGTGRAICENLAQQGAGVAIWDSDLDHAVRTAEELTGKHPVVAVRADVTDRDSVEQAMSETLRNFPSIEILINNAGIAGPTTPTWEYPGEHWDRVLAVNLTGPFNCCQVVVPHMRERGYGRIVNIASIAGKEGNPGAPAYSASKAGLIGLTKSLGKELADVDISVNCLTPAAAKTAIFDQMSDEHIAYMLSKIPRGRFAELEEIANMALFAASPQCSFTTGAVFDVSGGRATY